MLFALGDGKRALRVFFQNAFSVSNYAVTVQPDWPTMTSIVNKTTTGFTIRFSDPAPPEGGVVQVEGPVGHMYTAEDVVRRLSSQAWKRGVSQAAAKYELALAVQAMPLQTRERAVHHYVRSTMARARDTGVGYRSLEQRLVQEHLLEPPSGRRPRQAQKKKPSKDARLKALVNATIGG